MNRVISIIFLLFSVACSATPGPDKTLAGATLGAAWGAGAGAVIGHQTGVAGEGAGIGAAFGATSGMLAGMGLDMAEGTELQQQRELDALKVQVASGQRNLASLQRALDLRDANLGRSTVLAQIFFDSDKASIRSGSVAQLQRLSDSIKLNPYVGHIQVHGHSDDTGNTEKNLRLSEARARTIVTFLGSQGISLDQVVLFAHGAERPLASNETEPGRQLNRRAEIVLVK